MTVKLRDTGEPTVQLGRQS